MANETRQDVTRPIGVLKLSCFVVLERHFIEHAVFFAPTDHCHVRIFVKRKYPRRLFVRARHVTLINFLTVFVKEAGELADCGGVNGKRINRTPFTARGIFYESLICHMGQVAIIPLPVLKTLCLKLNCSHCTLYFRYAVNVYSLSRQP